MSTRWMDGGGGGRAGSSRSVQQAAAPQFVEVIFDIGEGRFKCNACMSEFMALGHRRDDLIRQHESSKGHAIACGILEKQTSGVGLGSVRTVGYFESQRANDQQGLLETSAMGRHSPSNQQRAKGRRIFHIFRMTYSGIPDAPPSYYCRVCMESVRGTLKSHEGTIKHLENMDKMSVRGYDELIRIGNVSDIREKETPGGTPAAPYAPTAAVEPQPQMHKGTPDSKPRRLLTAEDFRRTQQELSPSSDPIRALPLAANSGGRTPLFVIVRLSSNQYYCRACMIDFSAPADAQLRSHEEGKRHKHNCSVLRDQGLDPRSILDPNRSVVGEPSHLVQKLKEPMVVFARIETEDQNTWFFCRACHDEVWYSADILKFHEESDKHRDTEQKLKNMGYQLTRRATEALHEMQNSAKRPLEKKEMVPNRGIFRVYSKLTSDDGEEVKFFCKACQEVLLRSEDIREHDKKLSHNRTIQEKKDMGFILTDFSASPSVEEALTLERRRAVETAAQMSQQWQSQNQISRGVDFATKLLAVSHTNLPDIDRKAAQMLAMEEQQRQQKVPPLFMTATQQLAYQQYVVDPMVEQQAQMEAQKPMSELDRLVAEASRDVPYTTTVKEDRSVVKILLDLGADRESCELIDQLCQEMFGEPLSEGNLSKIIDMTNIWSSTRHGAEGGGSAASAVAGVFQSLIRGMAPKEPAVEPQTQLRTELPPEQAVMSSSSQTHRVYRAAEDKTVKDMDLASDDGVEQNRSGEIELSPSDSDIVAEAMDLVARQRQKRQKDEALGMTTADEFRRLEREKSARTKELLRRANEEKQARLDEMRQGKRPRMDEPSMDDSPSKYDYDQITQSEEFRSRMGLPTSKPSSMDDWRAQKVQEFRPNLAQEQAVPSSVQQESAFGRKSSRWSATGLSAGEMAGYAANTFEDGAQRLANLRQKVSRELSAPIEPVAMPVAATVPSRDEPPSITLSSDAMEEKQNKLAQLQARLTQELQEYDRLNRIMTTQQQQMQPSASAGVTYPQQQHRSTMPLANFRGAVMGTPRYGRGGAPRQSRFQ